MKTLVADDDPIAGEMVASLLTKWGYEVTLASNGEEAWQQLQRDGPPPLIILDWMMPQLDGIEVCRRVRALPGLPPSYIILLTSKDSKESIVEGLEAGADDYIVKPFDHGELRARAQVGTRVLKLQTALADRVKELEDALKHVGQLQGLLPICAYCKKIRDDQNYWHQVESYIADHSPVRFTHGVCPECYVNFFKANPAPHPDEAKEQP